MIGKQERETEEYIVAHLEKVEECSGYVLKTVEEYLAGNIEKAKEYAFSVHKMEGEADDLRRKIAETLYQGAFLPAIREDLINFVESVDKIADTGEAGMDYLMLTRPPIPQSLRNSFKEITKNSVACLSSLKEGFHALFSDFSLVMKKIHEINEEEALVDKEEWEISRNIFLSTEMDLAQKMLLRELVIKIADISDNAEDASDKLEILLLKKKV